MLIHFNENLSTKFEDVKKWKENFVSLFLFQSNFILFLLKGFLETEMKKEVLPLQEPEENLDAPKAREIIDLEVILYYLFIP
jgi:hypothetical protein